MKGLNLHIYPSTFTHETRMLKETSSLANSNLFQHVRIGAIWDDNLATNENLDKHRSVIREKLVIKKLGHNQIVRLLAILEWMIRIFFRYLTKKVDIISCHCLAVLPLGILFKTFKGTKIVYEAHELETERNGWGTTKKKLAKILEKATMQFVDHTIVVGDSIADWYKNEYNIENVSVVRNVPYFSELDTDSKYCLKTRFKIPERDILFLYQGILGKGRSIEMLLDVFSHCDKNIHITFMGYGPLEEYIRDASDENSNIHLHPAVAPSELANYTLSADVGLALFENTSLSYYYSCPNKLFEYIMGGLPVVVSDFPDMAAIIDRYDCGWKIEVTPGVLSNFLKDLTLENVNLMKVNTKKASKGFGWHLEEEKLCLAYKDVMNGSFKQTNRSHA